MQKKIKIGSEPELSQPEKHPLEKPPIPSKDHIIREEDLETILPGDDEEVEPLPFEEAPAGEGP